MTTRCKLNARHVARGLAAGVGLAAAGYAAYAGVKWFRYGHVKHASTGVDADRELEAFMPVYEVVERHSTRIAAPAEFALSTACDMELQQSPMIRAIFKGREIILRGEETKRPFPRPLLAQMKALGWSILKNIPGREIIVGAVTRPWESNVLFRSVPAEEFAKFNEPGYVKIVWTLRAIPAGHDKSLFFTETRATATDAETRRKFRCYWAAFSPGIVLIRRILLRRLKMEVQRRAREKVCMNLREADLSDERALRTSPG